ncbi:MAG: hypothetical protein AAFY91_15535, partial [Bacteroidota bacterium]
MGGNSTEHINNTMNESVASKVKAPAIAEAERLLEIQRNQIFIEDDAFIGNPYSLLGRVLEVRSKTKNCTSNVDDGFAEFSVFPIPGVVIDKKSPIKQPLKVKSLIVDKKLSLKVQFLNFLDAELDSESLFSVIVNNQAVGLLDIHDASYLNGMRMWIKDNQNVIKDPNICHLLVVTGIVQKNIIKKKYKKFDVKKKGGAFGLNVNGSLYTSVEDFSMDVRFGLSYQRIPIPNKTKLAKAKTVKIASNRVGINELNSYIAMEKPTIKGLKTPLREVQNEIIEKLF